MQINNYLRFPLTLLTICLFSSGLLSFVYKVTKPRIEANMLAEEEESLREIFPQAYTFEPVKQIDSDETSYYKVFDSKDSIIGYAFKAEKKGYSSVIVTMVGIKSNGEILNIKIISQNETPGLGSRVQEVGDGQSRPWFQEQFRGKNTNSLEDIETITGATISSAAVVDSIKEKIGVILNEIKRGQ